MSYATNQFRVVYRNEVLDGKYIPVTNTPSTDNPGFVLGQVGEDLEDALEAEQLRHGRLMAFHGKV